MIDWDSPRWLYRFTDAEGRPLYIGITKNPQARVAAHRGSSEWFSEATRCDWMRHPNLLFAQFAEAKLIEAQRPRFNRHHNPDRYHRKNDGSCICGPCEQRRSAVATKRELARLARRAAA